MAITLEASSYTVGIGGISVISATCDIHPCPVLVWSISDPTLVDIEPNPIVTDSWFLTGKSNGTVDIYVSVGDIKSNTIIITVTGQSLHSIEIDPKIADITVGNTLSFNATCKDQNTDIIPCPTLIWNSDNPLVATIDQTGKLTGISEGTTNITVSANGITSDITLVTVSVVKFGNVIIFGGLIIGVAYMIFRKQH